MISTIELKFGSKINSKDLEFNPTHITVFVGPNNSGKSIALKEIVHYAQTGTETIGYRILKNMIFSKIEKSQINSEIEKHTIKLPFEIPQEGEIFFGKGGNRVHVKLRQIVELLENPNKDYRMYCDLFLQHKTLQL